MNEQATDIACRSYEPAPLSDEQQREVCAIVSVGGTRMTAAAYVGSTVEAILYAALVDQDFRRRLRRAEFDMEVVHLANIRKGGEKNWRASAWLLERAYPDRYARPTPAAVSIDRAEAALRGFAAVVIDEIRDPATRDRIVRRLTETLAALEASAPGRRARTANHGA